MRGNYNSEKMIVKYLEGGSTEHGNGHKWQDRMYLLWGRKASLYALFSLVCRL